MSETPSSADLTILRDLAKQYAELCADPREDRKRDRWRRLNSLQDVDRPPIYIRAFAWNEMPQRKFLCEDTSLHGYEDFFRRRLFPEIQKAHNFRVTRAETLRLGCYDASDSGHFSRHRDDTTPYTAHRRFAMSLNLNTGEYDGGYLSFPEYGAQLFSPDAGGAVIFSSTSGPGAPSVGRSVSRPLATPVRVDGADILPQGIRAQEGAQAPDRRRVSVRARRAHPLARLLRHVR